MNLLGHRRALALVGLMAACGGPIADPLDEGGDTTTGAAPTTEDGASANDDGAAPTGGGADDESDSDATTASPEDDGDETTEAASADADATDDGLADTTADGDDDGDDGASVECTALMDCCDQLGADIYTGCVMVVDLAMPGLCDQILATYHGDGYCTGETFCADLGACCSELPPGPGWQDTCTYYADLGNQPQCAMLIGDYQLSGYCF